MTKEEIDILWNKAIRQSFDDGSLYTRYRFAALVAEAAVKDAPDYKIGYADGAAAERARTWTQDHWTEYERSIAAAAKAEERESWPAEMEAMERQVNILTDALAQAKAEEREACAMQAWAFVLGLTDQDTADIVLRAIRARNNA